MASFSATSEIVEAREETYQGQPSMDSYRMNYRSAVKEGKLPMVKVGYKNFVEEDINHLFKAISLKDLSKSQEGLSQPGTSTMRKSALKKPIAVPRSSGIGISEQINLKQALRELCLSKASEMAATKRLSKSRPSGASEAGHIKRLYNSVLIEASRSGASLVPEDSLSKPVKIDNLKIHRVKSPNKIPPLSPRSVVMTPQSSNKITEEESDTVYRPKKLGAQTLKEELARKEKDASPPSASSSNTIRNVLVQDEDTPASCKVANKVSSSKLGRKGRLQTVASPVKGNRASRFSRNPARTVKPVIRNKALAKKKVKQESTIDICSSSTQNEVTETVNPRAKPLICERCQCAIEIAGNESKEIYLESKFNSVAVEVSLMNNGKSGSGKDAIVKVKRNMKMQDKGEFSQSSKSSQGEYSSSTTSISEESNASGSSSGNRPHMSKDVRWEAIRQVQRQSGALSLTHFNLLKKLGCGDIGTVYLAELVGTNCLFAIKVMDNEFLARRKKMPRAQTEREILRMLDHPFLPTLYSQFTSDNLSCLVMEYCPGGDLHVLRQKHLGRVFSEPAARFYVAEVLLALEYLHMLGVVYRDLKPENILVREDGHIMLTDFDLSLRCTVNPTLLISSSFNLDPVRISGPCTGSTCAEPFCIEPACQVPCFSPRFLPNSTRTRKLKSDLSIPTRSLPQLVVEPTEARSNSFVGTHEYLAPEIIKGEGHGAAVDWWTFGVFLYELLYGKTPFKGPNNEETLTNVVLQGLKFPDSPLVSFQARDLIRGLLVKGPENRFGSEKGAAEIKQHPFFEGLNWALIRCAIPPELPNQFCDFDVTNFAATEPNKSKYLEYKASGEHIEFELF